MYANVCDTNTRQWGVVAAGLFFAFPIIWFRIKDSVSVEEDLKFSDETVQDVTVGGVTGADEKKVDEA